jgi:hypothetical protein
MTWIRHSLQQSVWEVMTEPSAEASRPTPMTVQPSGLFSAADRGEAAKIARRQKVRIMPKEVRPVKNRKGGTLLAS